MIKTLGDKCVNCGSNENVVYHHIVPLIVGGTNLLSNIVPVCVDCHKAIHFGQNLKEYRKQTNGLKGGRKRKYTEEQTSILDKYFNCKIGTSECKKLLGMPDRCNIKDSTLAKEYIKAKGIKSSRNNIDIILKIGKTDIRHRCVGYIEIIGAEKEYIYRTI